jgi:hypothetical protein
VSKSTGEMENANVKEGRGGLGHGWNEDKGAKLMKKRITVVCEIGNKFCWE